MGLVCHANTIITKKCLIYSLLLLIYYILLTLKYNLVSFIVPKDRHQSKLKNNNNKDNIER